MSGSRPSQMRAQGHSPRHEHQQNLCSAFAACEWLNTALVSIAMASDVHEAAFFVFSSASFENDLGTFRAQAAVDSQPQWHKMLASWLGVFALAVAVVFASPTAAYAEPLFGGLFSRDGGAAATLNKPDTPPTQELRVRMLCPTTATTNVG